MKALSKEEMRRRQEILINEYNGISPYTMVFYTMSIEHSAKAATKAFERFAKIKDEKDAASSSASFIHEGLSHCAAVSRFFWPPNGSSRLAKVRGNKLKEFYNISDSSPLHNRELRNELEHFDEKLDHFLIENDTGSFIPTALLGPYKEDPITKVFKQVDPDKELFIVFNKKFEYGPIAREIYNIWLKTGN